MLDAQWLTDRFALALSWLVRRNGAKDFSYAANGLVATSVDSEGTDCLSLPEPDISEVVTPEKQHIVPYSVLKKMFTLSGARPGKHEAHAIGNLTYISACLNGWGALSAKALNLKDEPNQNCKAHLLGAPEVLKAFSGACRGNAKAYARFCKLRAREIATGLVEWERETRTGVDAATPILSVPTARLIAPSFEDRMRRLVLGGVLSGEFAERLIRLERAGFSEKKGHKVDLGSF